MNERTQFGSVCGATTPVATSNSPSRGRVKLPQLTCAGRGEATVLSAASQDAPRLL